MADAMMMFLGEAHGVNWYWAQPGEFENPGVYYWDGAKNVLCVPHLSAPEAPAQAKVSERVTEFNAGRWCMSEDECINQGIDFSAYDRGVSDAARAFGKNAAAAAPLPTVVQKAVAWVPVHPKTGPLWAMTTDSPDPERLPAYPLRSLYYTHPALTAAPEAPAQACAVDERAAFEEWAMEFNPQLLIEFNGPTVHGQIAWASWQARAALAQKGDAR